MVERIKDIQNDEIRKLAETLKSSGLAASESEAIRIATGMSRTNVKVNQNFEERKGTASTMLANMNKVYPKREETPSFEAQARQQTVTQQPHKNTNSNISGFSNKSVSSGFSGNVSQQPHMHRVEEKTEIVKFSDSKLQSQDPFEMADEDEVVRQEIITREHVKPVQAQNVNSNVQQQTSEQPSQEQPKQVWDERKPKKDITKMEEHKVDLGSVFKFKG